MLDINNSHKFFSGLILLAPLALSLIALAILVPVSLFISKFDYYSNTCLQVIVGEYKECKTL